MRRKYFAPLTVTYSIFQFETMLGMMLVGWTTEKGYTNLRCFETYFYTFFISDLTRNKLWHSCNPISSNEYKKNYWNANFSKKCQYFHNSIIFNGIFFIKILNSIYFLLFISIKKCFIFILIQYQCTFVQDCNLYCLQNHCYS